MFYAASFATSITAFAGFISVTATVFVMKF
jgi:hypothetical protein